ncbi:porin [Xylanibacter muris]|nr:porin [Xylanibacter muris]
MERMFKTIVRFFGVTAALFSVSVASAVGPVVPPVADKGTDSVRPLVGKPKFSGYMIGRYQASLQDGNKSNSFDLRMARLSVGGRILDDFEYKIQGQINGNTSTLRNSPRIVDLFVEWQKYGFLKVKAGQFKRPFTFENPMNPIDQGFMCYSQNVSRLAGFTDRNGEHASNGRDIGVQLQGDFLPDSHGRNLIHYEVGVFNGQGINCSDVDNQKDVIGGLWVSPLEGMRIGAFGWAGSYARKGSCTVDGVTGPQTYSGLVSLNQYRYAFSVEYRKAGWQLRSEYIHSTGYSFKDTDSEDNIEVNGGAGNKSDGIYALCIAPVIPDKLSFKMRYDLYRKSAAWNTSKTFYEVGLNYLFHKNLELQCEYAFVNDRANSMKQNYGMLDFEFCLRF